MRLIVDALMGMATDGIATGFDIPKELKWRMLIQFRETEGVTSSS